MMQDPSAPMTPNESLVPAQIDAEEGMLVVSKSQELHKFDRVSNGFIPGKYTTEK